MNAPEFKIRFRSTGSLCGIRGEMTMGDHRCVNFISNVVIWWVSKCDCTDPRKHTNAENLC